MCRWRLAAASTAAVTSAGGSHPVARDTLRVMRCSRGQGLALIISALTGALVVSACGPAPGYGYDGRMLTSSQNGGQPGGYAASAPAPTAAQTPPPSAYQQPQQQQPQYAPNPGYVPAAVPSAPQAPAAGGVGQGAPATTPSLGIFTVPPYESSPGQPAAPIQAAPIAPAPIAPDPGAPARDPMAPLPTPSQAPAQAACTDACRFANNGECDDGRPGSDTDLCAAGTDCHDCGAAMR